MFPWLRHLRVWFRDVRERLSIAWRGRDGWAPNPHISGVHACCLNAWNLRVTETTRQHRTYRCEVCCRRHHRLFARADTFQTFEPGRYKAQ